MKKNTMMRIASFLLIAVLLSTSAISGTYAKYVTEGTGTDNARVAKFGVTVEHDNKIFYDAYKNTYVPYSATDNDDKITVRADFEGTDIIAPGTSGTMTAFTVKGQPEVDVYVSYDATLSLGNWLIDEDKDPATDPIEYCPIIITVNTVDLYIGGTDLNGNPITKVTELQNAVEAAIVAKAATYQTNENLATLVADDLSVSWRWAFDNTDAGYIAATNQNDPYDTMLGDNAAKDNFATISISVTCKVTQID